MSLVRMTVLARAINLVLCALLACVRLFKLDD